VNRGLARSERRRVIPSAGESGETANRESDSPVTRARIGRRPRVSRDRHPAAFTSPKAVRRSRDRGCNGHRILRRVPTDGRYPGSLRGVARHGAAFRVVSAGFRTLRPVPTLSKEGRTAKRQHTRRRVRREGERRLATGVPEVRSTSAPWEENAHAHHPGKAQASGHEGCVQCRPAEAVVGRRERPVPQLSHAEP
jgi:hypothetical protein